MIVSFSFAIVAEPYPLLAAYLNNHTRILLEVCVASVDDAIAAFRGGADRLELNFAIELGGLTPSVGLLEEVKRAVSIPVVAMVRPKPGGFHYSAADLRLMMRDAEMLLAAGADGIVSGALKEDGTIEDTYWGSLKRKTESRELIFHRAFDVVSDQRSLLKALIDLDTTRVLTSGGRDTAWEGREQIAKLNEHFGNQIELLPGSGISPENSVDVALATGCTQIHGSFSRLQTGQFTGWLRNENCRATSQQLVAATRAALDSRERMIDSLG